MNKTVFFPVAMASLTLSISSFSTTTTLPDPLLAGWQGTPVCEKLHEDASQRVLRCTFAPGVGHERHYHRAHFGYALSGGTMRIKDYAGTRDVSLKTNSFYHSAGTPWHEVINVGSTTVVYLIFEPKSE